MKRRFFLSRMALLTGGLLTGGFAAIAEIYKGKKIKGEVTDGKKGIANVVVSDGYSVVQTDKHGAFEISLHKDARFVFVSTPSGYAFPEEQKIARHYLKAGKSVDFKFQLQKLNRSDKNHQFIIWADTQTKNEEDMKRMVRETIPDVKKVLAEMPANTLVHGITVGDIVWDSPELYPDYCRAVKEVNIPFFQCIGNHDMDLNQGGDETSDRTFNMMFGPTHYSFNRGDVHYVVLDDVRYLGEGKKYDGYITKNQLDWLKKDLSFVPKNKLLVICAHIPILRGVDNRDELLEITKGYKLHIMTGHTHVNYNTIEGEIYEHNHGTVCGALWTGPICGDGTPNGYAVYDVKGTELTWYYKSTGKPKSHQFVLYHETTPEGTSNVLANVWNYDPKWKVECWLDGKYAGEMTRGKGFDPESVILYEGKELPKNRGFVDPKKTEHLFRTPIEGKVKEAKVVATDRFGNVYSSTIKI